MGVESLRSIKQNKIYRIRKIASERFQRIAGTLKPGNPLLLGATETLRGLSEEFEIQIHKNCTVFVRKATR